MIYPRVTEILRPFTSYDQVPKEILTKAAHRGSTVHALCSGIAKGAWIPDGMIGEECLGYVNSFRKWAESQVDKFILIEKRYACDNLQYTGELDFVVLGKDNELYLVDLKTSARPQKTYPIQMAAYNRLLQNQNVHVKAAMLVYLNKDGEFPNIDYFENLGDELQVFISALHCWNYFNKKGKKNDDRSARDEARDTATANCA